MKIFSDPSRWGPALIVVLLLLGVGVWLDVSLRMLPQPHEAELPSKTATHMVQRVTSPAR
jgi:hypothetical protein